MVIYFLNMSIKRLIQTIIVTLTFLKKGIICFYPMLSGYIGLKVSLETMAHKTFNKRDLTNVTQRRITKH